jgi:hypothetical protein
MSVEGTYMATLAKLMASKVDTMAAPTTLIMTPPGTSITGTSADLLVIDDPMAEAERNNAREALKEKAAEEIGSMTLIYPGGLPDGTVPEIESTPSTVHFPKNDLPSRRTEGKTHLIAAMREGLLVAQDMEEELVLELLHHVGRVAMAVAQSDNDADMAALQQRAQERYQFGASDPQEQMRGLGGLFGTTPGT